MAKSSRARQKVWSVAGGSVDGEGVHSDVERIGGGKCPVLADADTRSFARTSEEHFRTGAGSYGSTHVLGQESEPYLVGSCISK